jgi:hypothetical protein
MEKILDLQNQSSLAKLLATENITVTHKKGLKTAFFDVKNRVLGLPVWKDKGKVVYDMLVGHEVSHALYTPENGFEDFVEKNGRSNFDILNIIEDIRIERLIKNKYAGMPRIFKGAYTELVKDDFFQIADKNISELCFLDRLNLRGKIGNLVDIPLSEKEEELYKKCYAAETFDDVVELYHEVLKYAKEEAKEKEPENPSPIPQNAEGESEESENDDDTQIVPDENGDIEGEDFSNSSSLPDVGEVDDDGTESHSQKSSVTDEDMEEAMNEAMDKILDDMNISYENDESEELKTGSEGVGGKSDTNGKDVILEPQTTKALEENLVEEDNQTGYHSDGIALWPRKSTVNKHIISYKKVMEDRGDFSEFAKDQYLDEIDSLDFLNRLEERAIDFKKKVNKKVGVLVREFERRKAAYQYSRAQESRRGSLDVNKLHKYKYDDQIFQSVMHLADAKSHGMIFFIDYSGSMSNVLKDVLEHTLNLIHFCKKVGIPFKVYSFTSNYSLDNNDMDIAQSDMEYDLSDLVIAELFSSEMSNKEYNEAFKTVSCQCLLSNQYSFSQAGISKWEHLGGTPLNTTLMAAHHIIDDFRKSNPVQKLNVIVLTDGESSGASPRGTWHHSYHVNVAGKQRKLDRNNTSAHVKLLKDTKNVNMVGFFLPCNKREGNRHLNRMAQNARTTTAHNAYRKAGEWMKVYRKDKIFQVANCFGYDSYFLLSSDIEIEDEDEFTYEKSAGKTIAENRGEQSKLAREFTKHNVSNRTNRIIMTKFAEIIA